MVSRIVIIAAACVLLSGLLYAQDDAEHHYKVALVALKDQNLAVALDELKRATVLAPDNAVMWYYLAVVQSKKDDPRAAQDSLERASRLGIPADLKESADELSVNITYQMKKRNQTPRLLFGQGFALNNEPGYADVLQEHRDQFIEMLAGVIADKDHIAYAKYSQLGSGAVKRAFDTEGCKFPEGSNPPYSEGLDPLSFCVRNDFQSHAEAVGKDLEALGFDAFVYFRPLFQWTWQPGRGLKDIDTNWLEFTAFIVTVDGKFASTHQSIVVGRGFAGTETEGRNPNIMFAKMAIQLRAPLQQLLHTVGY